MTKPNRSADVRDHEPLHPGSRLARPDLNAVMLEWTRRRLRARVDGDEDPGPAPEVGQLRIVDPDEKF